VKALPATASVFRRTRPRRRRWRRTARRRIGRRRKRRRPDWRLSTTTSTRTTRFSRSTHRNLAIFFLKTSSSSASASVSLVSFFKSWTVLHWRRFLSFFPKTRQPFWKLLGFFSYCIVGSFHFIHFDAPGVEPVTSGCQLEPPPRHPIFTWLEISQRWLSS